MLWEDVLAALAASPAPATDGVSLIAAERQRQGAAEGYTTTHDDQHNQGELAEAAASYALTGSTGINRQGLASDLWPWLDGFKPGDRLRDLVKAGALIAAEIDRLRRAAPAPSDDGGPR